MGYPEKPSEELETAFGFFMAFAAVVIGCVLLISSDTTKFQLWGALAVVAGVALAAKGIYGIRRGENPWGDGG